MGRPATCDCGECRKCKHRVTARERYRANPEKGREAARLSRLRRIEAVRAYDRARGFRLYDPRALVAHNAARSVPRQPCEVCGEQNAEKHHDDYNKPRDVRFFCKKHHAEHHRRF